VESDAGVAQTPLMPWSLGLNGEWVVLILSDK